MIKGNGIPISVLLADSNAEFRSRLRALLEEEGCEVYEAHDIAQTFDLSSSQPIEKVVLALNLGGLSGSVGTWEGLSLIESFRKSFGNIPIVLVGDLPEWEVVRQIIRERFCDDWVRRIDGPEAVVRALMPTPIILHLSDLQFGPFQREMGIGSSQTDTDPIDVHIRRMWHDLSETLKIHPNVLVITGDITEHGLPQQFEAAESFIRRLANRLNIPIQRIVVTPGNHDICWYDSRAAFQKAAYAKSGKLLENPESDAELKSRIVNEDLLFQKFLEYGKFYDRLYNGIHKFDKRLFDVFDLRNLNIVVASLNSCVRACHLERQGWIGNDQIRGAGEEMNRLDPHKRCVRLGVFHHHIVARTKADYDDRVEDFGKIAAGLQRYNMSLLMHGHQHKSDAFSVQRIGDRPITILAAGSMLLQREKTLVGNQYQVVEIKSRTSRLYLRRYDPDRASSSGDGDGEWVPDTSFANASEAGTVELQI